LGSLFVFLRRGVVFRNRLVFVVNVLSDRLNRHRISLRLFLDVVFHVLRRRFPGYQFFAHFFLVMSDRDHFIRVAGAFGFLVRSILQNIATAAGENRLEATLDYHGTRVKTSLEFWLLWVIVVVVVVLLSDRFLSALNGCVTADWLRFLVFRR